MGDGHNKITSFHWQPAPGINSGETTITGDAYVGGTIDMKNNAWIGGTPKTIYYVNKLRLCCQMNLNGLGDPRGFFLKLLVQPADDGWFA